MTVGAALVFYPVIELRTSSLQQMRLLAAATRAPALEARSAGHSRHVEGSLLGTVEIPAIGLEVAILEGVSDGTLMAGPGHVPGTALPGEGVSVIAAHRDLHFRNLHEVQTGDAVLLRSGRGRTRFRVTDVDVVRPDSGWVTAPGSSNVLRLVTCWPPRYLGPAPRRLVVSAAADERTPASARSSSSRGTRFPQTVASAVLPGTPLPATTSGTAGASIVVLAFFSAWQGRRTRGTFLLLCTGATIVALSLWGAVA